MPRGLMRFLNESFYSPQKKNRPIGRFFLCHYSEFTYVNVNESDSQLDVSLPSCSNRFIEAISFLKKRAVALHH
jgi:hypothetical protein